MPMPWKWRAATIKCDLQLMSDDKIVMSHNPILNHEVTQGKNVKYFENGRYDIRTMTVDEVKQFKAGHINPDTEYYKHHSRPRLVMMQGSPRWMKYSSG